MIQERLAALRSRMKEEHVDAYLVPTDDFHCSEYVGDYFKCRKYITGFTGSAGTAVITMDEAGLTDGILSRPPISWREPPSPCTKWGRRAFPPSRNIF